MPQERDAGIYERTSVDVLPPYRYNMHSFYIAEGRKSMKHRLFVFLVALLIGLGMLLLLSALIETPQAETAEPAELPSAHSVTAFAGMPPVPTSAAASAFGAWLKIAGLFAVIAMLLPRLNCTCDANGRVLCKRRYVRSFYPVFKQDLACG